MYPSTKAAFLGVDKIFEDAARILIRASEWHVFFTITLPLSCLGVVGEIVLSFARALGQFGVTIMVAGHIPGKLRLFRWRSILQPNQMTLTRRVYTYSLLVLLSFPLSYG